MDYIEIYFLYFVIYSIAGWAYETIICSVQQRRFVNRGFLNGPYCPIYGSGAVLNVLLIGRLQNPILIFILSAIISTALEYLTSWLMEKMFHARWWDYSDMKFNIGGRVFLLGAVVFGLMSVVQLKIIHPRLSALIERIPADIRYITSIVMFAVLVSDTVYTVTKMSEFDELLRTAAGKIDLALQTLKAKYESAGAAYPEVFFKINTQIRRTIASFPKFRSTRHNDKLKKLRELLRLEKILGERHRRQK